LNKRTIQITALLAITVLGFAPFAGSTFLKAQTGGIFTLYVLAPSNNPARITWAGICADSFRRAGIDARLALEEWGIYIVRLLFPTPENVGDGYADGGWDTSFLGWTWGTPWIDPTTLYDSASITIYNYLYFNDTTNDDLLQSLRTEPDQTARDNYIKDWQAYVHEISASAVILYPNSTFAWDPGWTDFEDMSYAFPSWGDPQVRSTTETAFVVGQNADPVDYTAILSTAYYDGVAYAPCYEPLFYYDTSDDLLNFVQTPALATGDWVSADAGLNWTLSLRDDVYWPTGHRFNASDVALTFKAIMTPAVGASQYGTYTAAGLTNESIVIEDEFTIRIEFDPAVGGYGWTRNLFNDISQPLPSFVMKDVPFSGWRAHGINAGTPWTTKDVNDDDYTTYGPMGLGPYVCNVPTSGWQSTERAFVAYRRGTANDAGLFNGTKVPYYLGVNGHGTSPMPDTYVAKTLSSATAAIAALQTGEIDLIDYQFQIQTLQDQIQPAWGSTQTRMELGYQFLGFNMLHPILGTGVQTPNGQTDSANAATYAKYVRQALNHLIPRQTIIDTVFEGFGMPGVECIPPIVSSYNTSLQPYDYNPVRARQLLQQAGYEFIDVVPPPPVMMYAAAAIVVVAVVILIAGIWRFR
jgi:ABC-type transport system substrate-binding protein